MTRANLGELEEQVLLTLIRLGGESCAVDVADTLSAATGRAVSPATTFMVMRRLARRGLVTSRVEAPDGATVGRPRRHYRVNRPAAVPLLRASRRARLALWDGLEGMLR
jgi:DNA-binding PadR family transcriptional regulator